MISVNLVPKSQKFTPCVNEGKQENKTPWLQNMEQNSTANKKKPHTNHNENN